MTRVLVCTAHPDDEMLIAGSLRRLCATGADITLVCATQGEQGAIRDPRLADRASVGDVRSRELEAAARVIGISQVVHLCYPDGQVRLWADGLRVDIAAAMARVDPDLVITFGPDGVTAHEDHITVGRITTEVALEEPRRHVCHFGLPRPLATRLVVEYLMPAHEDAAEGVAAEEGFENADEATRREWLSRLGCPPGELDLCIDVSDLLDIKAAVFRCHASQPGSDQAGDPLFHDLFAEEFFRSVKPGGAIPPQLQSFVTEVVPT
jgi:LmbE family N-acetylglucosaminyl deacetylase